MKGKVSILVVLLLVAVIGVPSVAASGSVGYVDFEFLFNAHPEYDIKNGELQTLAEEMTAEFQTRVESLESDEEIEALAGEYEAQLDEYAEDLRISIIASVQDFIAQLAEREEIAVVLPDTTIIYGGVNLTPMLLEFMYESYGISVPSHLQQYL